jgi:hypothetical protein
MAEAGLELRFVGHEDFIRALAEELESGPREDVEIVSQGQVHDATDLRLDVGAINDLVSIVTALFFAGPIVPALRRAFRRSPPGRISIESPFGKVTFEPEGEMTDEELRAILGKLAEL